MAINRKPWDDGKQDQVDKLEEENKKLKEDLEQAKKEKKVKPDVKKGEKIGPDAVGN